MYGSPLLCYQHARALAPTGRVFNAWYAAQQGEAFDLADAGSVAVLFARSDSIYKTLPGCDVFDIRRDARLFAGGRPVVAHPPCRAWGRLRHLAKPRDDEKALALFAVHAVRTNGGVLEHPAHSTLWPASGLPVPGTRDEFGGWTLPIYQDAFGHACPKATWLYVVGCEPANVPALPFDLGHAAGRIQLVSKSAREKTPADLAKWLVELALKTRPRTQVSARFSVAVSCTTATKSPLRDF